MKFLTILMFFLSISIFCQKKINGISFVASNRQVNDNVVTPIIKVNANWVALMPFAFMKTVASTNLIYNDSQQWWGERKVGIEKTTEIFRSKNIKVMIKPQIWIPNGFTGHIKMISNNDWIIFENNYEKFILEYATLAEKCNVEMFCIGTELNFFVIARPNFWKQLIIKIRLIYSGKITYAENWDSFDSVLFLNMLDFIGVDAYFPLSNEKTPEIKNLVKSWQPIKIRIKNLSEKFNKKIIFTEYGYQSKDFTVKEPWESSNNNNLNLIAQQNALASILAVFWKESWFEGGFLWKWYDNHDQVGGILDKDYTIQNKSSEKILEKFYK